jgi:hypothetical protein
LCKISALAGSGFSRGHFAESHFVQEFAGARIGIFERMWLEMIASDSPPNGRLLAAIS